MSTITKGNKPMELRRYSQEDLPAMAELFYQTVHTVCARDYTPQQLRAWAGGQADAQRWHARFSSFYTLVAVENAQIVGFGNIDESGYIDFLYVHKDFQRCGVATALCDALESVFQPKSFTTHASITARPFFEHRGYHVVKRQQVLCRGVEMTNYMMEKCAE